MALLAETTQTFYNWTDSDFTHTWNKEPYTIKKGMTIILPTGIAETFAYHLAVQEMNNKNIEHGRWDIRDVWLKKAFVGGQSAAYSPERMEIELLNANKPVEPEEAVAEPVAEAPKKRGRPPVVKKEEAFEGVNE